MKISRTHIRRIIREERRRLREDCGGDMHGAIDAMAIEPAAVPIVAETLAPEQEIMVEMEVAQRSLEAVVESVQSAAALCPSCGPGVATQAPLMEAMVTQAEALQEMLDAQVEVVAESVDVGVGVEDIVDVVGDLV